MRIVSLNTDAKRGLSARTVMGLHQALRARGVDATLVTLRDGDPGARLLPIRSLEASARERVDGLPQTLLGRAPQGTFSTAWLPNPTTVFRLRGADIVHMHNVGDGLISIEQIGHLRTPLVWTMHDTWAVTGGCHDPHACTRYRTRCGQCPALGSTRRWDLSTLVFERKRRALRAIDLTLVAPSRALQQAVTEAQLAHNASVEYIPHGIDLQTFRPQPRVDACALLGVHPSTRRILCGNPSAALDPLRDFDLLLRALRRTKAKGWELTTFGVDVSPACRYPVRTFGRFDSDEMLAAAYGTADVFVLPARDAKLPVVLIEALACGLPCVAFDVGGVSDIIDHQVNGYLAKPFDPGDLAAGIDWVLKDPRRWQELSEAGRDKARRCFDLDDVAARYEALYRRLHPGAKPKRRRRRAAVGHRAQP